MTAIAPLLLYISIISFTFGWFLHAMCAARWRGMEEEEKRKTEYMMGELKKKVEDSMKLRYDLMETQIKILMDEKRP